MRRSLVFTLLAGAGAIAGCSLFVDLDVFDGGFVNSAFAAAQEHPRSLHACAAVNMWLAGDDRITMQAR